MASTNTLASSTPPPSVGFASSLPPSGPVIVDSSPVDVSSVSSSSSSSSSSIPNVSSSSRSTSLTSSSSPSSSPSNSQSASGLQHSSGSTSQPQSSPTAPPTSQSESTSQVQTSSRVQPSSLSNTHRSIAPAAGGAVGGLVAVCILIAAVLWMRRRIVARKRRARRNDVMHGLGADDEHSSADPETHVVDDELEKCTVLAQSQQENTHDDETLAGSEHSLGADAGLASNRTTLVSDRATVGVPHPASSPQLPLLSLPKPDPVRRMQPRQETDGGVRLAGGSLSLRRASSSNSDGVTSRDSLVTLPPPYQPHY